MNILTICGQFDIEGSPAEAMTVDGGHINDTFRVTASSGRRYILQRINTHVMQKPRVLMQGIAAVTAHLRRRGVATLDIIPTLRGELCLETEGGFWRMYSFVENASCHIAPRSAPQAFGAGAAFGGFIAALDDMPPFEACVIPQASHDTPFHFSRFLAALKADSLGRARAIGRETELALSKAAYAGLIYPLEKSGVKPRLVHNDAKFSNIMIDDKTDEVRCVLDLDNVMPGSAVCDYGDGVRSCADRGGELDLELAAAFTRGFAGALGLEPRERELMPLAPLVITYENALRYLTDYLEGDVYFKNSGDKSLEIFRERMQLLSSMERNEAELRKLF